MDTITPEKEQYIAKFKTRDRWRMILAACDKRPVTMAVIRMYQSHKGYAYNHLSAVTQEFVGRGLLKKTQEGNKHYYEITKLGRVILAKWPVKPPIVEIYEKVFENGKSNANVSEVGLKENEVR